MWIARVALLLVAALLPWRVLSAIVAGLVLALTAAAGHAGAENNPLQLGGDVIHLLAAGAWLGGLAPFAWAMRREDADVVAEPVDAGWEAVLDEPEDPHPARAAAIATTAISACARARVPAARTTRT